MGIVKVRTGVTALILGATLAFGGAGVASASPGSPARAAATASSFEGCPSGYVCIYPFSGFNGGKPDLFFYTYGNHNLVDVIGVHMLVDNQTGHAWDFECSGYGGTGTTLAGGEAFSYADINFTPVNSVRLKPDDNPCTG